MATTTKIQWCDATVNVWQGCAKVPGHPGCAHCYAEADTKRWGWDLWGKHKPRKLCKGWPATLRKLNKQAEREGRRLRVFINSESDFFEEFDGPIIDHEGYSLWKCQTCSAVLSGARPGVQKSPPTCPSSLHRVSGVNYTVPDCFAPDTVAPLTLDQVRASAFGQFDRLTHLDLLLLTKRPELVEAKWPQLGFADAGVLGTLGRRLHRDNVWIGASISNQETADRYVPELLKLHALTPVLFLSIEPLLGPVDLLRVAWPGLAKPGTRDVQHRVDVLRGGYWEDRDVFYKGFVNHSDMPGRIRWVIIGGESGPKARPCHDAHVRSLVEQCQAASVAPYVKQLGSHVLTDLGAVDDGWPEGTVADPEQLVERGGDDCTLLGRVRLADPKGGDPAEWPEDLRVRQFPDVRRAD